MTEEQGQEQVAAAATEGEAPATVQRQQRDATEAVAEQPAAAPENASER